MSAYQTRGSGCKTVRKRKEDFHWKAIKHSLLKIDLGDLEERKAYVDIVCPGLSGWSLILRDKLLLL